MVGRKRKDSWEGCLRMPNDNRANKRVNDLIAALKNNGIDFEKFRKAFASKETGSPFHKDTGFPDSDKVYPLKKWKALQLHFYFKIDFKLLVIEEGEENTFFDDDGDLQEIKGEKKKIERKREDYFLNSDLIDYKESQNENKVCHETPTIEIIPVPADSQVNDPLKDVFKKLAEKICQANQSITIWECTFKGNNNNPGLQEAYCDAQQIVFKDIIKLLKKKPHIKYRRIFHLSPYSFIPYQNPFWQLVDEMSLESLEHLLKCYADQEIQVSHEFKLAPHVTRFRCHCLIDETTLLTEDYIKLNDEVVPRLFFFDSLGTVEDYNKFVESIKQDDNRRGGYIDIKVHRLKKSITDLIKYYNKLLTSEDFISMTLDVLLNEINKLDNSKLVDNLRKLIKVKIEKDYRMSELAEKRMALHKLDMCLKNPDRRVFKGIIDKRGEFEIHIQKRLNRLKEKLKKVNEYA